MNNQVRLFVFGGLLFATGCGSTLPLVFVDKTNVGLEIAGPNPTEGTSGSILLGFKTRSAAIVPVAVHNKTNNSTEKTIDPVERERIKKKVAALDVTIQTLNTNSTVNSAKISEAKKEKNDLVEILSSTTSSYDKITSTKNGDIDALSVLGQFQVDSNASKEGVGVGLGRFFATGSAASRLADGFAAKLGAKQVALKANDDLYETNIGDNLKDVSVLANDLVPMGVKVMIRVPPKTGEAKIEKTGALTYTPDTSTVGVVIFSYAITDQLGNTSSALVKVTVKAKVSEAPAPPALPVPPVTNG